MSVIVNNINKFYGRQKALNQVSFTLEKGEICGFLGPNGAGKSTMMKIITGCLDGYEGDVNVCGIDVHEYPLKAKALIGYLPEHNPLYPDMYIKEYLLHVARLYNMPHAVERVNEVAEQTGLTAEYHKKIGQLSKGYRQRVGLAQALVHNPEVLILDEPMTGLDPNQLDEIRNLITHIGHDKTVMLSTHIMQEVEAICDRIIIINQGEIVTDRYKKEWCDTAGNAMVIHVEFSLSGAEQWLVDIPGIASFIGCGNCCYQLTAREGEDPRIDLFKAAVAHEYPIIGLHTEEMSMELLFRQMTQKTT